MLTLLMASLCCTLLLAPRAELNTPCIHFTPATALSCIHPSVHVHNRGPPHSFTSGSPAAVHGSKCHFPLASCQDQSWLQNKMMPPSAP